MNKHKVILVQLWIEDGDRYIVGLARLGSGENWNGTFAVKDPNKITQSELRQSSGGSLTRYWDNAKQAKVGEKSEQGKSEAKLRDGDCYCDGHTTVILLKNDDMWLMGYGDDTYVEKDEAEMLRRIKTCGYKFTGTNIFDDLTETSEGFEMRLYSGRVKVCPTNNGRDLVIRRMNEHDNYTSIVRHEDLAEFHRKLGHVLNHIRSKT